MLKNIIGRERRRILVDKSNVGDILEIIYKLGLQNDGLINLAIGNCGWAKAPDCYYIYVTLNDRYYYKFMRYVKDNDIELLPETTGF